MAITLGSSGIVFPDGTTQSVKFDATDDRGSDVNDQKFFATGTWSKPAGVRWIRVLVQGGGAGGGGHGECGGAGGFAEKWIDVSSWATSTAVAVTIGGGGAGTTYNNVSASGGTTSFGAYVSATGGGGSNSSWSHTGGVAGIGSGGDINLRGGSGSGHNSESGSQGGGSYFGGSMASGHHNAPIHNYENNAYNCPGGGGSPSWTTHTRGAYGQPGCVIVYAYK